METAMLFGAVLSIQILDIVYCLKVLRWYEKKKSGFRRTRAWHGFYIY